MRFITDLHVHSKYARATSPRNEPDGLAEGAKIKGIDIIATGDYTHPAYFNEIKGKLKGKDQETPGLFKHNGIHFLLSTELAVTFELDGKNHRMHHIVLAPSFEVVAQINERMAKYGNLQEDGRPMLKISSEALAEELFGISQDIMIIPAHAWTPWFSIFGSKGGLDSIEEAFGRYTDRIHAIETGLSSDPAMNWMLSKLDKYTLVSNSDAHSLEKLGREANVLELDPAKLSYKTLTETIKTRNGFLKTYEFYPEEGKYHYDGHRDCKVVMAPWETKDHNGICPVCRRKLTVGVMNRVFQLSDRNFGFKPPGVVPFQHIVPLMTIISKAMKKSETSRFVIEEYGRIVRYFGTEFSVFEATSEKIRLATSPEIANAIIRSIEGRIRWRPGYDGEFGDLILDEEVQDKRAIDKMQKTLGDY